MSTNAIWLAYNTIVLLLACGLSTAFFFHTESPWSFAWLLLLYCGAEMQPPRRGDG